jgi:hypothetical protein
MTDADPQPLKRSRIGRSPNNDIVISDLEVSKQHAELRRAPDGRYSIIDLGSHGGTYINGARVGQAELAEGDIVSIGHATFKLYSGGLYPHPGESPGSGDDPGESPGGGDDPGESPGGDGDPGVPEVTVTLSSDEALVLSALLRRLADSGETGPLMPGEQTALRALSGYLKSSLAELLEANYRELVDKARQRLAERGGA